MREMRSAYLLGAEARAKRRSHTLLDLADKRKRRMPERVQHQFSLLTLRDLCRRPRVMVVEEESKLRWRRLFKPPLMASLVM